jgi:6-phosphogluconolactonase
MNNSRAFIGTYTSGYSKGIYTYDMNTAAGTLFSFNTPAVLENPSYLVFSKDKKYLYAVVENSEYKGEYGGAVAAFSITPDTGELKFLNYQSTKGKHPCHLCVDSDNKYLFAANYSEGSFTVFPINEDGSLKPSLHSIKHQGSGPNKQRQEAPHVHFVSLTPEENHLCVIDLGIDSIVIYDFDKSVGALKQDKKLTVSLKPGSGPRHLVFHPDGRFVYVITELSCEVAVFKYCKSKVSFEAIEYVSTLPQDYIGNNTCAAIQLSPDGKYLYASNRGHDSIAVFRIDNNSGKLELVEITSTSGNNPRDFTIDPTGHYLYAANQDSDNITAFIIDNETGRISSMGKSVEVSKPVCIKFY